MIHEAPFPNFNNPPALLFLSNILSLLALLDDPAVFVSSPFVTHKMESRCSFVVSSECYSYNDPRSSSLSSTRSERIK